MSELTTVVIDETIINVAIAEPPINLSISAVNTSLTIEQTNIAITIAEPPINLILQTPGPQGAPGDMRAQRTVTTNYSPVITDSIIKVDATTGAKSINLPPASEVPEKVFTIKKIDSSENAVTINGDDDETIDGQASITFDVQWEWYNVASDGLNWILV